LIDLFTKHQSGKMYHGRRPHPGADIGRACGQIAKLLIKCEIELRLQRGIDFVDHLEGLIQVQPAGDCLHAEMVFLIDHNRNCLRWINHHSTPHAFCGVLPAD
jgi:hypothetical protein